MVILKILITDLGSCGVNYQNEYIIEILENHFEFTNNLQDANIILMLGTKLCF